MARTAYGELPDLIPWLEALKEPDMNKLTLTGDANVPAMPMTDAQVNHLRRLLAWLDCEYMLSEHRQRGCLAGAKACLECGVEPEHVQQVVEQAAQRINHVPAYVRQGVRMLTKALRDHERKSGVVDVA